MRQPCTRDLSAARLQRAPLAVFLVVSGASSLVYQVVWARKLSWFVGTDAYAVSVVLAAFFAGLGLGSALFGARADRAAAPLQLYAAIELGIALCAAASTQLLDQLAGFSGAATASLVARCGLALVVLLPPTVLIGGTFPVLSRVWIRHQSEVGSAVGILYTANTCGALAGTLLAGFVLIRLFGLNTSIWIAAAGNLGVALCAWRFAGRGTAPPRASNGIAAAIPSLPIQPVILGIVAAAGFAALASEVLWTRALIALLSTRAYAFSIVLTIYLLGIVLGSALVTRLLSRSRDPWVWLSIVQGLAGATTLTALLVLRPSVEWVLGSIAPGIQAHTGSTLAAFVSKTVLLPLIVLLPPTVAIGCGFPLTAALACTALPHVGRHLGRLYAANTAGGIAGALIGGLLLLPWLGMQNSLTVIASLNAVLGVVAATQVTSPVARRRTALFAAVATALIALSTWWLPAEYYLRVATRPMEGTLRFFREDPHGTVAVVEEPFLNRSFNRLIVDGVSNSGDSLPSQRYMRLQTHLPVLLHQGPVNRVLVICFGTGITYAATFAHPDITTRRCVELSPAVLAAAPLFHGANGAVETRSDADIRVGDGRVFLQHDREPYDVITLEPPPPIAQGVVNLYSSEFYTLCRQHLRPGGIMAQWLPLPTQNLPETRMLMRTFLEVFPQATLWTTELHETLLLGSLGPLGVDLTAIAQQLQQPTLQASLGAVGIHQTEQLLATFLMDADALRRFAGDAPLITDDHPRIEYASFQVPGEFGRQLDSLLQQRSELTALASVAGIDVATRTRIEAYRQSLFHFYDAGIAGEAGDTAASQAALTLALQTDPANEYFHWFLPR